jgi:hypothetical protein
MKSRSASAAQVAQNKDFYMGILVSLAVIYAAGAETVAEELVREVGPKELLAIAKAEDDIALPDLRKTIRFLASRERSYRKVHTGNLMTRIDRQGNEEFDKEKR